MQVRFKLIQALSHPLRIVILGSLEDGSRTPGGLAGILNVDTHKLVYHFKVLNELELIRRADQTLQPPDHEVAYELEPQRFTTLLPQNGEVAPWGQTAGPILQAMMEGGIAALEAGMIDTGGPSHLSHASAVLDAEGWQEVTSALSGVEDLISRAKAGAAKRLADGAQGVQVTIVLAAVSQPSDADGYRTEQQNGQPANTPPSGKQASQGEKRQG